MSEQETPFSVEETKKEKKQRIKEEKEALKQDIKETKEIIKSKTSRDLNKNLNPKTKRPSWWRRNRRNKLVSKLEQVLTSNNIDKAWAHDYFLSAEEKNVKNITIYIKFNEDKRDMLEINRLEDIINLSFKKNKITIIDIDSLLPSIREFVFKDISPIF